MGWVDDADMNEFTVKFIEACDDHDEDDDDGDYLFTDFTRVIIRATVAGIDAVATSAQRDAQLSTRARSSVRKNQSTISYNSH